MDAPMPTRLSLFTLLLLLAALLLATAAHGAPAPSAVPAFDILAFEEPFEAETEEEGESEEVATDCDTAYEEADEGELSYDDAEEICEEGADVTGPPAKKSHSGKPKAGKSKHRPHRHGKTCRRRASGKRHCSRRAPQPHQAGHPRVR
jgi:hypothetical protein